MGPRMVSSDDGFDSAIPLSHPPPFLLPRGLDGPLAAGRPGPRVTVGNLTPERSQSGWSKGDQVARGCGSRAERQRLPPRDALLVHLAAEDVVARRFGRRRWRGRGCGWQREQRRKGETGQTSTGLRYCRSAVSAPSVVVQQLPRSIKSVHGGVDAQLLVFVPDVELSCRM